jgi:hypothetical protein
MKDITAMAREAWGEHHEIFWFEDDGIEKFAALVRADAIAGEREACAKVCESIASDGYPTIEHQECADAIRARGNT